METALMELGSQVQTLLEALQSLTLLMIPLSVIALVTALSTNRTY